MRPSGLESESELVTESMSGNVNKPSVSTLRQRRGDDPLRQVIYLKKGVAAPMNLDVSNAAVVDTDAQCKRTVKLHSQRAADKKVT